MKKEILIFLNVLIIHLIRGERDPDCQYSEIINFCLKNGEIIYINATKLKSLDFNAPMTSLAPYAFRDLSNLKTFRLVLSSPLNIQKTSFEGLTQLEELGLSSSFLSLEFNVFAALKALRSLHFYNSRVVLSKKGSFSGLSELRSLYLAEAGIVDLEPGTFLGLEKLEKLILRANQISTIRRYRLNYLLQLRQLDLSCNNISVIEAGAFDGLNLRYLHLQKNKLTVLVSGTFRGVSIYELLLYWNIIADVEVDAFGNSKIARINFSRNAAIDDPKIWGVLDFTSIWNSEYPHWGRKLF